MGIARITSISVEFRYQENFYGPSSILPKFTTQGLACCFVLHRQNQLCPGTSLPSSLHPNTFKITLRQRKLSWQRDERQPWSCWHRYSLPPCRTGELRAEPVLLWEPNFSSSSENSLLESKTWHGSAAAAQNHFPPRRVTAVPSRSDLSPSP